MDPKPLSRKKSDSEMCDAHEQENVNEPTKPYLMGFYSHKITPIGFDFHQVEVPPWSPPPPGSAPPSELLRNKEISKQPKPIFLASRISHEEIEEYLTFIQNHYDEKIPDYFAPGSVSLERTKAKALDFLHQMNYNVIRAKFFTLFPTYIAYNSYRLHDPLSISDQEMERKTRDYVEGLKNTKEKDTEKWIQSLEQCLENRTPLAKFVSLVQVGKVNKLEVPQHIKEQIQRAQKAGREIKKSLMGNKFSIEMLREKKKITEEHKIITSEMISLEDTVNRCEEWLKKLKNFEDTYFFQKQNGETSINPQAGKIQFRQLNALVNQYNNLPLSYPPFESTIKKRHAETLELLDSMPTFNRVAKTRTAKEQTVNKIGYSAIKKYLKKINEFPVWHEEFSNFQINMRESVELMERLNMFLEDPLSEKTSKILNNYIKLISDVQIENNIEKRLKQRQEYNEIMEKIKREITNPGKVQSIKEAYNKLKEKGIKEVEDSGYQQKILLYLGWHQSQQKLKDPKPNFSNVDLIIRELEIKKRLVNAQSFKEQLESAQKQLNVSREDLEENYARLEICKENERNVSIMLKEENPDLEKMIKIFKECLMCGLSFPDFEQLYENIIRYFEILLKIQYILKVKPENLESEIEGTYYFTTQECDSILAMISYQNELKDLKTKEGADSLLTEIRDFPFPRYMKECSVFENFMKKGEEWAENVRDLIKNFSEQGQNIDVKELEESRYYIHSRAIKEEIGKIEFIMKWREKIKKKLDDGKSEIFDEEEEAFFKRLEQDLLVFESTVYSSFDAAKKQFLEYSKQNNLMINRILEKIANDSQVDNICKLSEMNKFHREIQKEIQKHKIDDKIIMELKSVFQNEINLADEWKERYLMIKRCEKKKLKKDELDHEEDREEVNLPQRQTLFAIGLHHDAGHDLSPNEPNSKKRFSIRNVEFTIYFKFLIIIYEFYQGYKLKFSLEELLKLKNNLSEIHRFIQHFEAFNEKKERTDLELSNLEVEGAKIQIFIREYWILKKKNEYVLSWRQMADTILDSVPIVNMELKARKPEELLLVLANKKIETEEANKSMTEEKNPESFTNKRERKPNSLYSNNEITLFFDENIGPKVKKRKKCSNGDTEYRNTAVASQAKKNARNKLEDIQRTEALLKGQIPVNFIIEDPKEYCICRFGEPNENTTMVQCQGKCEEWFHIECIGIKKHQAKGDSNYVCIACNILYGLKTTGNFYWNYRQKISEYAFSEIVEEGKKLEIFTQQFKKIKVIDDKLQVWKNDVNNLLLTIARDEFHGKPLADHKDKIYQLFLLSFWLPSFHPETEMLRRLLLLSRGEPEYI